jgi:protein-S-isoprenylcysteine O-methyltransferase Ste14
MKAEYRITIGGKQQGSQSARPAAKLEIVKAAFVTLLALSVIVGVCLATFVVGSVIAIALLILLAISILAWLIRWLFLFIRKRYASG